MPLSALFQNISNVHLDPLGDFLCDRQAAYPHPSAQFNDPIGQSRMQLIQIDPIDKSAESIWSGQVDSHGRSEIAINQKLLGGGQPMPKMCTADNQPGTYVMKIDAELEKPLIVTPLWPPYPQVPIGPQLEPEDESLIGSVPPLKVDRFVGPQPNALICQHSQLSTHARNDPRGELDPVYMPLEMKNFLDQKSLELRMSHERPVQASFASRRLSTAQPVEVDPIPRFDQIEEIRVLQLQQGKMKFFDHRLYPHPTLNQIDPSAARENYMYKVRSKAIPAPVMKNHRFFYGSHDGATLHPTFQFRHPAHFVHAKMFKGDKIVWDAEFEASGHVVAADQKSIGGKIEDFPGIEAPFGKTQRYTLIVEADNPRYDPPYSANSDKPYPEPQLFKRPLSVEGAGQIPGDRRVEEQAQPSQEPHADSEHLTDYWRKVDFIFGVQRPIIHANYPIAVTRL